MDIVLDTNCLIMSLSPKSPYRLVWREFLCGHITLCVSNDIMEEYEEVVSKNIGEKVARITLSIIAEAPNVKYVDPYFHFWMIDSDIDDNKFTDCAVAANARYIVTEDHHFKNAKSVKFPKVNIIGIDDFIEVLRR